MYADTVLMIEPVAFGFNAEAAATNTFARGGGEVAEEGRLAARRLAAALRAAGVRVELLPDTPDPPKPDAVFPNNWVSFHPDGRAFLYPMAVASRRPERRADVLARLAPVHGTREVVDLTALEAHGAYLEGTGSLLLDHDARVAFACRSPRTTDAGLAAFADASGYRVVAFDAALDGAPVYHTNVILALAPGVALLAEELVAAPGPLRAALAPREVIPLDTAQVRAFAGNVLVLATPAGPRTVMSTRALAALRADQLARLPPPLAVELDVIETIGGGGARCMLAEVFRAAAYGSESSRSE